MSGPNAVILNQPDGLVGVVWVCILDGERYSLVYAPTTDGIPLPRRTLARGLRQLADAWEAEADRVGD